MATNLVQIKLDENTTIYAQASEELIARGADGLPARGLPDPQSIYDMIVKLGQMAQRAAQTVQPNKVAVEFAIGVEGKTGIPFLAEGGAKASITVTVEWEHKAP